MTTVGWKFGTPKVTTPLSFDKDFSSRILGFSYDLQLAFSKYSPMNARVTLDNRDGALTPGGGGTFSSFDWFSNPLVMFPVIDGTMSSDPLFAGMTTDFKLDDDGINSSVTLTLGDLFLVISESTPAVVTAKTRLDAATILISQLLSGAYGGKNAASTTVLYSPDFTKGFISTETSEMKLDSSLPSQTFAAFMSNVVLPGLNAYSWLTDIFPDGLLLDVRMALTSWANQPAGLTPVTLNAVDANNASSTAFRITNLVRAWNRPDMVNNVTVTPTITGGAAQYAENSTSIRLYGSRTLSFTQTSAPTNAEAYELAARPVRRWSVPKFVPRQVTITSANIAQFMSGTTAATNVKTLLSAKYMLNKLVLKFKPTGSASTVTQNSIIMGKQINANPSGFTMTLTLADWADNHSWVLNTDILGTDRLG